MSRQGILLQFSKYVVVGGAAFVIDFLTLYCLTEWFGIYYIASASIGFLAGLIFNYGFCLVWIFDHRAIEKPAHEFIIFSTIGIVGLILNNAIIYALTEFAGLYYLISKLLAAAVILMFNFVLRRQILFTKREVAG